MQANIRSTIIEANGAQRAALVRQGRNLEFITIAYNCLEGLLSIIAGVVAGSPALIGFGGDSVIEVASGLALVWRLRVDMNVAKREQSERRSLRLVGVCFMALAVYVSVEAVTSLMKHEAPQRTLFGILLAAASLIVMPLLSRAKRKIARGIDSRAMAADAKQTDFCAYLSAILLGGLMLNWLFGWWWADAIAALVMTPIIAREGYGALRGKTCCGGEACC